jgi:hypothetical protein
MLSGNRLVEIPKAIGQLKELRELWVGGNPLSDECKSWLKDRFGVVPAGVIYDLE